MVDQTFFLLTDKAIARLPLAADGQYKVHDTELKGFLLLVGKRLKSYMAQGEFWREGTRGEESIEQCGYTGDLVPGEITSFRTGISAQLCRRRHTTPAQWRELYHHSIPFLAAGPL